MSMILPSIFYGDVWSGLTPIVQGIIPPFAPVRSAVLAHDQVSLNGVKTIPSVVKPAPKYAKVGLAIPGMNSTLYDRIIIEPSDIELGNVTSAQTMTFRVWNGFFSDKVLSDLVGTGTGGVSISEPLTVPGTIKQLAQLTYTVTVTVDGPYAINCVYTFTIGGVDYEVTIKGSRTSLLQAPVNWASQFLESLEWKTDIIRSFSGKEQRRQLRLNPRRSFEYDFAEWGVSAQKIINLMRGWQNRPFAVPVWTDPTRITAIAAVGTTALVLDTTLKSFAAGGSVLIVNGDSYEMGQISTLTDTEINVVNPLVNTWPIGSIAYPIQFSHLPEKTAMTRKTDTALIGKIEAACVPGESYAYIPTLTAGTTYNGYEVLTQQPNWKDGISFDSDFAFGSFDNEVGLMQYNETEDMQRLTRSYAWLLKSRTEITNFRGLLGRLCGMKNAVYVPTWTNDFTPVRDHYSTEKTLLVKPNLFRTMVGVDATCDRLMIRTRTGGVLYRKILDISTDGTYDVIELDATLGVDVLTSNLAGIHVMQLHRMATDKVTLEWHNTATMVVQLSFVSVPA